MRRTNSYVQLDPAVIEQARQMDLLTYLQHYEPSNLMRIGGNVYCTAEHDSLKISNGKWYWWSRGFGGVSALDYVTKVKKYSFVEAVEQLTVVALTISSYRTALRTVRFLRMPNTTTLFMWARTKAERLNMPPAAALSTAPLWRCSQSTSVAAMTAWAI